MHQNLFCIQDEHTIPKTSIGVFTLSISAMARDPTWQSLHPKETLTRARTGLCCSQVTVKPGFAAQIPCPPDSLSQLIIQKCLWAVPGHAQPFCHSCGLAFV